jgi:heme/copper-type cytochrome/quinol oxidase subunit 4
MSNTILGKDAYWMNFFGLMVLTLIEVGAVGIDLDRSTTLNILTVIAIPKFMMIAAIFMHLWGENDSGILTLTALFPAFFIIVMVLFIGLTHPEGATGLPAWCRPGTYGL